MSVWFSSNVNLLRHILKQNRKKAFFIFVFLFCFGFFMILHSSKITKWKVTFPLPHHHHFYLKTSSRQVFEFNLKNPFHYDTHLSHKNRTQVDAERYVSKYVSFSKLRWHCWCFSELVLWSDSRNLEAW